MTSRRRRSDAIVYQSLFAFSMMGLVLAPNLLQLFMCWELVGLVMLDRLLYRGCPRARRGSFDHEGGETSAC
jgi:formate hydrogenlyase subunit 3/multisubunit Na+/H+ antiporter MnhD subunit